MNIARLIRAACATIVLAGSALLLPGDSHAAAAKCVKIWIVWSGINIELDCEPTLPTSS